MIDSLLQKWSGDFLNAIRELKTREIYYQIMAANSYWLQTNRECKIVCVNLKEELKKGKPSPYDWNRKNQSEYGGFPHGRFIITALLADDDSALKELFRAQVEDAVNQFLQNEITAVECLAVVNGQTLFYKHSVLPFIFLVILDSLPLELPSKWLCRGVPKM